MGDDMSDDFGKLVCGLLEPDALVRAHVNALLSGVQKIFWLFAF